MKQIIFYIIITCITAVAAIALAPPVVFPTAPPAWFWLASYANPVAVQRLPQPKVTQSNITSVSVGTYTSVTVTHSWLNVTESFVPPAWSLEHRASLSSGNAIYILYTFPSTARVAVRAVANVVSGYSTTICIYANSTSVVSGSALIGVGTCPTTWSGVLVAGPISATGTGSWAAYGSWVNVTAFSIAVVSRTTYTNGLGARFDAAFMPRWFTANYTFTATVRQPAFQIIARFSTYHASVTPAPTEVWQNYAYWNATANPITSTFTISFVNPYPFNYTVEPPQPVTLAHYYTNGSSATTQLTTSSIIYDSLQPSYVNISTTTSWIKIVQPQTGDHLRVSLPFEQQWISFYVKDFGQGYQQIRVYTQDNRIVWREWISTATSSATARLTPYAIYILSLWKPGEERVLGPITIDRASFNIEILPAVKIELNVPFARAIYNASIPGYTIDVNCSSPPCTIILSKRYLNGTVQATSYNCTSTYCRFTWITDDPLLIVSVTDASGRTYTSHTGTTAAELFTERHKQSIQNIFAKIAEHVAAFDGSGGMKFTIAMIGVLIFLAITVPGHLLTGLVVLAVYNAVAGILFNITLLAWSSIMIIIAVAVIHYVSREI